MRTRTIAYRKVLSPGCGRKVSGATCGSKEKRVPTLLVLPGFSGSFLRRFLPRWQLWGAACGRSSPQGDGKGGRALGAPGRCWKKDMAGAQDRQGLAWPCEGSLMPRTRRVFGSTLLPA